MSNQVAENNSQKIKKKNPYKFEGLFKWLVIVVGLFIIPTFFNIGKFRQHCQRINNYTADLQNVALWIVIGFVFNFIAKKLFHPLFAPFMQKNLSQIYLKDQQYIDQKVFLQTRQLYDTIFHFGISFFTWYSFYQEQWYPSVIGGYGTCQAILSKPFYWPSASKKIIEALYAFQIGSILCHTFQHTVTERRIYLRRNFYELLFHHIVTISLESISLFYNLIDVGIVIMILHDFSDGFRCLNKIIKDSSINQAQIYSKWVKRLDYVYIGVWCSLRVIIFPICALEAEMNAVISQDMLYLFYQGLYLRVMSILIILLQGYWLYYIVKLRIAQSIAERKNRQYYLARQKLEDKKEN